jgi:hypothetical protein
MKQKTRRIIGWALSALPLLFMAFASILKFTPGEQAKFASMLPNFGYAWVFGLVLLVAVIMYLIPKTQVFGFVLASTYMGGAAAAAIATMGPLAAIPIFVTLILFWSGQAMLRPSLLKASTE